MTTDTNMDGVQSVLDIKAVEKKLEANHTMLEGFITKSNAEIEATGKVSTETKAALDKLSETVIGLGDQVLAMEQSQTKHFEGDQEQKSLGEQFVESDQFATFAEKRRGEAELEVKTAIVNAVPSLTQPLTAGHRLTGVVKEPDRVLRIRDLLLAGTTDSNIVWYPKEDTFTNNAAVQTGGSPTIVAENVAHPESAITFTSASAEVKTIGHFVPVSLNALADSSFLKSYVDGRLMYGLKLKEDTQLITGSGTLGTIEGIYTARTAYTMTSPLTYTTKLDVLRDAKAQAQTTNYTPDLIVLNPTDWAEIELSKETNGMYIFSNPAGEIAQVIWGMRVVLSNSMTAGAFLVGCSPCAQIWDRLQMSVSISYEDGTNFQKDMATLKANERLALTIYNNGGFIGGSFAVA